ncbi:MAG: hypothetical protein H0U89_01585 [Acidimicrobiia bacterium]|nr:hypothetical protein [Acidimicrobiia bacterium]
MELRDVRLALRRYWLLALLVLVLCVGLGAAAAFLPAKTYEASATLTALVPPREGFSPNPTSIIDAEMPVLEVRATSRSFRNRVRQDLAEAEPDAAGIPVSIAVLRDSGSPLLTIETSGNDAEGITTWANAMAAGIRDTLPEESAILLELDDPAFTPRSAAAPQPTPILIGAFVLGAFLALLATVGAARVRQALDLAEEVRKRFDAPVLGQIPPTRRLARGNESVASLLEDGPPELIEAFQSLRTNLDLLLLDRKPTAIAVASWSAGEGKSTVAAGLALSMAAIGRDVVVIDADLRRPTQHDRLGERFGPGELGLADLGNVDVQQVLRRTRYEHLWLLPAGVPDRHPADVVTVALPRAAEALAAQDRLLLIDAPPLHGVAETPFVLSVAHHVILVVDAASVKLIELEQAVERLRGSGLVLLGVVINRVRSQGQNTAYDSYLTKPEARRSAVDDGRARSLLPLRAGEADLSSSRQRLGWRRAWRLG